MTKASKSKSTKNDAKAKKKGKRSSVKADRSKSSKDNRSNKEKMRWTNARKKLRITRSKAKAAAAKGRGDDITFLTLTEKRKTTAKRKAHSSSASNDDGGTADTIKSGSGPTPKPKRSKSSSKKNKKKSKKSKAQSSAVTPSPVGQPQAIQHVPSPPPSPPEPKPSPWLAHDTSLLGADHPKNKDHPSKITNNYNAPSVCDKHLNVRVEIQDALLDLMDDPLFLNPFGVIGRDDTSEDYGSYFDEEDYVTIERDIFVREWKTYSFRLCHLPSKRLYAVKEEFTKDRKLHSDLLQDLSSKEINERRFGGTRYYLRALHCMLFSAFERCSVPLPPLPRWKELTIDPNCGTRKDIYRMQLRAWNGYQVRAFAMLGMVAKIVAKHEADMALAGTKKDLPPIEPLSHRGDMVPMAEPISGIESCTNEEKVIDFKIDWSKDKKKERKAPLPPRLPTTTLTNKNTNNNNSNKEEEVRKEKDDWENPVCNCCHCMRTFDNAMLERLFWEQKHDEDSE